MNAVYQKGDLVGKVVAEFIKKDRISYSGTVKNLKTGESVKVEGAANNTFCQLDGIRLFKNRSTFVYLLP